MNYQTVNYILGTRTGFILAVLENLDGPIAKALRANCYDGLPEEISVRAKKIYETTIQEELHQRTLPKRKIDWVCWHPEIQLFLKTFIGEPPMVEVVEKTKKSTPPRFAIGWKKDAFVFKSPSGFKSRITGPHTSIVATLKGQLPAWYGVALQQGDTKLAEAISREADNLGIIIYLVRERDIDGFRFEVVDGPSVHARVVDSFETEAEANACAKKRNAKARS